MTAPPSATSPVAPHRRPFQARCRWGGGRTNLVAALTAVVIVAALGTTGTAPTPASLGRGSLRLGEPTRAWTPPEAVPGAISASPTEHSMTRSPALAELGGATPSPWNASGWYDIGLASTAAPPGWGSWTSLAYDPVLHGDLFFGGSAGTTYGPLYNQTWLFNASGWHELSPSRSPPVLAFETMAWDAADAEMVLFGGSTDGGSTLLNATWAFANGTWTNVTQPIGPPRTQDGAMFSDGDDGSVILFGGEIVSSASYSYSNATWKFVGGKWHPLAEQRAPSPRELAGASWDSSADEGLLFGGYTYKSEGGPTYESDTWAFVQGAWTPLSPAASPSAREAAVIGDDPALGGAVLYGGVDAGENAVSDTWVFAGNNWTVFSSKPSPPTLYVAVFPMGLTTAPDGASLILLEVAAAYPNPEETWEFSTLQPSISTDPTVQENPTPVALSVSVIGTTVPQNFTWSFGDGTVGNGSSVAHLFPGPGTYLVTVTVVDQSGRVANATQVYSVYSALVLTATVTPLGGVAPLDVRFTGSLSGGDPPYALDWTSGSIPDFHGATGSVEIVLPGSYSLTCTGTDAANYSVTKTFFVTVVAAPAPAPLSAVIVTNVSAGPVPLAVSLAGFANGGTPPYEFAWRFSDGATDSVATVARTLASPGNYSARLTVNDAVGDVATASTWINASAAFYVTVAGVTTTATGTVTLDASGFDGAPPYAFYWEWGDGTASTGAEGHHVFGHSGTYAVELTGIDSTGRTATAWANVSVGVPRGVVTVPAAGPGISLELVAFAATATVLSALAGAAVVMARRRRPPSP